jgi:hypothetical protein
MHHSPEVCHRSLLYTCTVYQSRRPIFLMEVVYIFVISSLMFRTFDSTFSGVEHIFHPELMMVNTEFKCHVIGQVLCNLVQFLPHATLLKIHFVTCYCNSILI